MADSLLAGTPATISITWLRSETEVDASGAVTIEVLNDAGDVVVPAGSATVTGTVGDGRYDYTLTEVQLPQVDRLRAVWTGTFSGRTISRTTYHDVVGGFVCSLAELRSLPSLSDPQKYPTADLASARAWFERTFERHAGVAVVPRYERRRLNGSGGRTQRLGRPLVRRVLSASVNQVAVSDSVVGAWVPCGLNDNAITSPIYGGLSTAIGSVFLAGHRNLDIAFEHGMDEAPEDVHRAALTAIRARLVNDQTGPRPYQVQTSDMQVLRFARPGPAHPFGDDEVDEVANAYAAIYKPRFGSIPTGPRA